MSNPRIAEGFDARAADPELHLLWEQGTDVGATLPASYFDGVRTTYLGKRQALLVAAQHIAPREILIRLAPEQLAQHLVGDSELSFTLEFPDRRDAIDCMHPAMGDAYYVHITLKLQQGTLQSSLVTQDVHLGEF